MPEISVSGVEFGYSGSRTVLKDVSFHLNGPGLFCIVGPNGVGKSTLIKCVDKLLTPSKGCIEIDGRNIAKMRFKDLSRIVSYVPVSGDETFSMPVIESVILGIDRRGSDHAANLDRGYAMLKLLGMEDLALRSSNELSAGQRQKIAIARGLIQEPEILILDEPTANLDIMHQLFITELLRLLSRKLGIMVLMISHDLNIAAKYADELIVMEKPGTVSEVGSPEEVISEDMIRRVYGVNAIIVKSKGRPQILLDSVAGL